MKSTLEVGGRKFFGIGRGNETCSEEALAIAQVAVRWQPNLTHALVHRYDGLVIFNHWALAPHLADSVNGIHFMSALCGYGGTGPATSAAILNLYGFGSTEAIMDQISHGGDNALFSFEKMTSATV